jgi:hypothetical protein
MIPTGKMSFPARKPPIHQDFAVLCLFWLQLREDGPTGFPSAGL